MEKDLLEKIGAEFSLESKDKGTKTVDKTAYRGLIEGLLLTTISAISIFNTIKSKK